MSPSEQKRAAKAFIKTWKDRGDEKQDTSNFWNSLLHNVLGVDDPTQYLQFEKPASNGGYIDVYFPATKVLVEQKSYDVDLDKKEHRQDKMVTPFEQARDYMQNLIYDEKPKYIITCNFSEFRIYDTNVYARKDKSGTWTSDYISVKLENLEKEYYQLQFLVDHSSTVYKKEMEISLQAGELVGVLYDALRNQYKNPDNEEESRSLNILCVRIVFCLYAEDADVFGKHLMFHDYLNAHKDDARTALIKLFKILDTPANERTGEWAYESDDLLAFPYVNGGLFRDESVIIPKITPEIVKLILDKASEGFDWSKISPTIFGAVFESTLNPETRRSGGMHYTSIENIHKVIDPLFLDDLHKEFEQIIEINELRKQKPKLEAFQNKLAKLTFFDPACGSGNFLTESYLSLRRLENKVILQLTGIGKGNYQGQLIMVDADNPVKVSISNFFGIEINDFAVTVAKTALWIAESQMLEETKKIVLHEIDFLPLKTNANIVEGNALRIDWESVVPKSQLNYIMGNPPFVGARIMNEAQKQDVLDVFGKDWKNVGNLDYVCCWYKMATEMMSGTSIRTALVSTNSVSQGETVANLWKPLFESGVHIDFAHRTFRWDSEAKIKAHVHCVIIGFSIAKNNKPKALYTSDRLQIVKNINGYLIDADNVFVESRNKALCDVPDIGIGNKPIDGGNYLFTKEEKDDFIKQEPMSEKYFRLWYGSQEFINRSPRYCLWLGECSPAELRQMPNCMKRIEAVRNFRLSSTSAGTVKLAEKPTHFHVENMPSSTYIVVPKVSSEKRRYVPMGLLTPDILCSDLVFVIPNATLYHFGVLTSNVHMAWVRAVCGRLKSDYRYSKDVVYNNFPWPTPSEEQKAKIEATAQAILDARALYPDSSLADLYDELTMPPELRKAHQENDRAVMNAYGFSIKDTTESSCVAELMKMYKRLTEKIE